MIYAQACDPATPTFTINLSGKPDSVWTSTAVQRDGNCCGTTAPDKCIEFNLLLDSGSNGIRLDIPTGALPGGALFYQIGCGTAYQVGQDICLNGPGPHRITFCKPGNNVNTYQITAIPKPDLVGKLIINEACVGHMKATGLVTSTITWQSVPNNATHNSYLNCLAACDSVSIIPTGNYPNNVTYRVCGNIIGGCGAASFCDTATVKFVSNIDVDIQPKNATVCFGGSTTTITANPVGGLPPYSFLWNNNQTTPSIQVSAGTYFVQMLDSLGCLIARDTVVVTSFASPIDVQAGNDSAVCSKNSLISLNGLVLGGVGGIWKNGSGSFSPNDTTINATYMPSAAEIAAGVLNLKLVTTRNGTCPPDSDEVVFLINPTPVFNLTGPAQVCANKTSSYSATFNLGNTYLWNVIGGTITATIVDTLIQVLWGNAGPGSVSLIQTNSANCDSTKAIAVNINPTPVFNLTGPAQVCANKTSAYSATFNLGNTYLWNVIGGTITATIADTLIQVLWGSAGPGSVSLKQTNSANCDSTKTIAVNIAISPTASIIGITDICAFKSSLYSVAGSNISKYKWSVTNGTIIGSDTNVNVDVNWGNAPTATITLNVISAFGCDTNASNTINIKPAPIPIISGQTAVCAFTQARYRASFNTGNAYTWLVTGGSFLQENDTTILVTWHDAPTGNVSLKITTPLFCDSTVVLPITIHSKPKPILTGPLVLCEKNSATFKVSASQVNLTTTWQSSGRFAQTINDTQMLFTFESAGLYNIQTHQVNTLGCDTTVAINVLVNPKPIANIEGDNEVCKFAEKTWWVKHQVGNTYLWSVTGGNITSGVNTDTSLTVRWNTNLGVIQLKITNSSGCDSTIVKQIIVREAPNANVIGDSITCNNVEQYTYSVNSQQDVKYKWSVNQGNVFGVDTGNTIQVGWTTTGFNQLNLYAINTLTGCDSNFNRVVFVDSIVKPNLNLNKSGGCIPFNLTFEPSNITVGDYTYTWSFGNGITSQKRKEIINFNTKGIYPVKLIVTNKNGCKDSVLASIIANNKPIARQTYNWHDGKIYANEDTIRFINQSVGGNVYIWKIVSVKTDTLFETSNAFTQPGYYKIWLTAIDTLTGCIDSFATELKVWERESIYAPNAFTPNGDGKNDFFSIGSQNLVDFDILIVNRWGEIVFRSTDPDFKWDGTFKNQSCQDDVYVYLINARGFHGQAFSLKGTVTLIR